MAVDVKVPALGESINEVQIADWFKQPGDWVELDEPLVELESDKATVELPAPSAGRLVEIVKQSGEFATIGDVVAVIDEAAAAGGDGGGSGQTAAAPAAPAEEPASEPASGPASEPAEEAPRAAPAEDVPQAAPAPRPRRDEPPQQESPQQEPPQQERSQPESPAQESGPQESPSARAGAGSGHVMPAARRAAEQAGVDPATVRGSGPGGRVLKEDVVRAASRTGADEPSKQAATPRTAQRSEPAPQREEPARQPADRRTGTPPAAAPAAPPAPGERRERVVPMSPIRRRIAERLVQAQQTAALLTTFQEVDMGGVMTLRKRHQEAFQERHGVKLGFMSFFVRASIEALRLFPELNAEVRGQEITYRDYYDIGVAIGSGKGLVVPIVRDAEHLSFAQIEERIADFAARVKSKKIDLSELEGGTFTISNGGVYGSLLSTPIVNPPQSGILGLHTIQDRAVVVEGEIVVRPMMYLALTYDHRLVDGREAVSFLRHVKHTIEQPERLLLQI
ncbi:MAG: 2-oxoglutarate dehydrogenase complex dihydrolipoyllysine-residue succinyltransferase [Candidatus Krumholzibacteriia bacterium]